MQVINATLPMLKCKKLVIGFEGENQRTQVRIDASPIFAEYPSATPSLTIRPVLSAAYPVLVERDGDEVVWDIVAGNLAINGDAEMQLTFQTGDVICKTCIGKIHVRRSLQVTGDMPDPVAQWIDDANAKLHEVDVQIVELEGMVNTATDAATRAEQSASTASTAAEQAAGSTATATEKATEATNAATTATAKAAEAEQSAQAAQVDYTALSEEVTDLKSSLVLVQANQPIEAVNKLWVDSDTVTETEVPTMDEFNGLNSAVNSKLDAPETAGTNGQVLTSDGQGGQSWETPSGGGAVQDVQVNGESVMQDGVANVPVATKPLLPNKPGAFGVVRIGNFGVTTYNNTLCIDTPTDAMLKQGTTRDRAVTVFCQEKATFYGLAKAAGSDEKNSTLPVGQYTEAAKSAILKMIGADRAFELIKEYTVDSDISATSPLEINTDINGESFELDALNVFIDVPKSSGTTMNGSLKVMKNGLSKDIGLRFNNFAHASYEMLNIVSFSLARYGIVTADIKSQINSANSIYTGVLKITSDDIESDYAYSLILRDNVIPAGTVIKIYGHRI